MKGTSAVLLFFSVFCNSAAATEKPYTVSASTGALAPNAGGQEVYFLRLHHDGKEAHGFLNKTLSVGSTPLFGAGYDLRFDACEDCFWKAFVQVGGGLSNAGVYAEFNWGAAIPLLPIWLPMDPPRYVPQLRIDFSTHLIFGSIRPSVWSYPLCIGFALPI